MVSNPQHEPTMEEILASIRKIISEDSTEQAPAAEPAKPAEPASDILDLTQEVAPEPAPAPEPVEMEAAPENDVVFENIDPPAEAPSNTGIFTDEHRSHLDNAFAALDEPEEDTPAPAPRPAAAPGSSVESVFERAVRDAFEPVARQWLKDNAPELIDSMKPLIREWLDEHFPALLEGAVREEVARVAKARGKR